MSQRHNESIAKTVNLYRVIQAYIAARSYPPSFRDIIDRGAFTSTFVCHWHMRRLKEWGLLESEFGQPRTIRLHPITSAPTEVQKYFEDI